MKRVAYLDDLRALATVAVVVIHVASNNWYGFVGTPDWVAFTVYAALCKFCVPVFFMISGALFLDRAKQLDVKRLYCHNILKLAVFLVVWSFIYQIFHIVESGSPVTAEALLVAVKNVLRGNTQTHFWFIYAMIGIYIVSPIIKVFTDNASKRMLEYFLVLWLVLQSFFDSLVQIPIIAPVFHNIDKMMIQVTASYLGFFVLGHYLAEYGFGAKRRHASYTLGAVGIIVSLVITIYMSMRQGVAQETCFGYFFPGIVFYSAAIFIWFRSAIGNGAERESAGGGQILCLRRLVSMISRYSLGIYAVHMLFVFVLWDMGFDTFLLPGVISVPLISGVVLLLSLALTWLLSKAPFINTFLM